MANLPSIYDSNVTTKKNSLDKILPMMAKDIGVIKTNFVKLIQQQTGQRAKSEAFFAKALQKENMYESRYGKRSSYSPNKVGSEKQGMLFDSKVGVFDFIKGFLNNVLKGMVVGGGIYGLAKIFDNPEFRKSLSDFFANLFTVFVKGIEGAANFLSDLTKSDKFRNAVVEAFVAISNLFINSISMIKDVLSDDRVIKSIKDVAANLIKTIGDVLKTEVDLGKVGPINVGKHSLGSILGTVIASMAAFRVALIIATGRLLAIGAGYKGGGGGGRGGSRGKTGGKGGGLLGLGAIFGAYEISKQGGAAVSQALDDWAQKHISEKDALKDDDDLMSSIEQSQQGSNVSSTSPTQTNKEESFISGLDPVEAALLGYGGYQISKDLISKGNEIRAKRKAANAARASAGKPTPKTGFPRGPLSNVTPSQPQSKIIPQRAGSGARDYERIRSMGQAAEGMYSGKRAPLPPQEQGMVKKIGEYLSKIWKKGLWSKLTTFLMKKMGMAAALRFITVAGAWVAGTAASGGLLGPALAALGYALLAYDIYMIYEYVKQFWEEESGESTSPTPVTPTKSTTSSPTKNSNSFDYERYKNFVGQFESSNNYKSDNTFGYVGRYQMGSAVLEQFGELKKGSFNKEGVKALYNPDNWVKPGGLQAFLNDPSRQDNIMKQLTDYLYGGLQKSGVIKEGMSGDEIAQRLYAAHHGGLGGANALFGKGEIRYDKYLAGSSTLTSAQKMAQAMGGHLKMDVPLKNTTQMTSSTPRISADDILAKNWMAEDAKRNAASAGVNVIGSFNNTNSNESKDGSTQQIAAVSAPWNEEHFFKNAMKFLYD